jgi:hypothetical protein
MLACQLPTINSNWHHLYLCIAPLLLRFVTICSVAIIMADPVSIEGEQQQQASVYIYTEQEAHVLDGLEEEARRLFAPSVAQYCYQDVKSLKSAVESWSHSKGAHTSPLGQAFFCKRGDTPAAFKKATEKTRIKKSIPAEKHRARKTMRCGCEFVIRFAFASKAAIKLGVPAGAVRITPGSSYRHTNGCFPSQSQLIVDKKRAGAYQAQLNDGSLLSLMEVLRSGRPVPCAVLREMMRPLYPPSMAIYAKEVGNMRQKVNQLWTKLVSYLSVGGDYHGDGGDQDGGDYHGDGGDHDCGDCNDGDGGNHDGNDGDGGNHDGGNHDGGDHDGGDCNDVDGGNCNNGNEVDGVDSGNCNKGGDEDEFPKAPAKDYSKSVTYGSLMEISKRLCSAIVKSGDIPNLMGRMLQLTDDAEAVCHGGGKNASIQQVSYVETFTNYQSQFSRNLLQGVGDELFATTQGTATRVWDPLQKQGTRSRGEGGGRPPTKRLKTNKEKAMLQSKKPGGGKLSQALTCSQPSESKCSFCCLTGHRKGQASCDTFTALQTTFITYAQSTEQQWARRLGDQTMHYVEMPSMALRQTFSRLNLNQAVIPREVHHVLLRRCFFSRVHMDFIEEKRSAYKHNDRIIVPPSVEDNVLEVSLYREGGLQYDHKVEPSFMLVSTVREWIRQNVKQTGSKYLMNSMRASQVLTDATNTY